MIRAMRHFVVFSSLASTVFAVVPTGFSFLGFGYDVLQGNPLDTHGNGDLGYKSAVFAINTQGGSSTPDGKWTVPDKTTLTQNPSCSHTLQNNTIKNDTDYLKSMNFSFNINGSFDNSSTPLNTGDLGLKTLSFQFNINTHDVHVDTENKLNLFFLETFQCSTYKLAMNIFDHPPFTDNFKFGLDFLPSTYSESEYMMFIQEFGTHVTYQLEAGGRWGWQVMIDSSYVHTLEDKGVNVDVGLNVAAKIKAGFDIKVDKERSDAETVVKYISRNSTFNLGGEFSADPEVWRKSIADMPMPVHVESMPIHMLLNPKFFPGTTDLAAKKAALMDAINYKYCPYLKKTQPEYSYVKCPEPDENLMVV